MEKKEYKYRLTLEALSNPQGEPINKTPIEHHFQNHDDLYKIIEMAQSKNLFENPNDSIEFSLGLKLFSEVMLKNRDNDLFEEFAPAFGTFMKKLKSR